MTVNSKPPHRADRSMPFAWARRDYVHLRRPHGGAGSTCCPLFRTEPQRVTRAVVLVSCPWCLDWLLRVRNAS